MTRGGDRREAWPAAAGERWAYPDAEVSGVRTSAPSGVEGTKFAICFLAGFPASRVFKSHT